MTRLAPPPPRPASWPRLVAASLWLLLLAAAATARATRDQQDVDLAAGTSPEPVRLLADALRPEEPCSRAGGVCIPQDECPVGHLSEELGLCPKQRHRGVECCHGLSTKERRCAHRGGQCMPPVQCGQPLQRTRDALAEDCLPDELCCMLVALN